MKPTPKRAAATVVRLSMTGETHQPNVVDTLRWGDAAHKAAVRISGGSSPALSGIDPRTDKPFADPKHPHAFYIPADEYGDGGLDTLTIWAPDGLSEDDVYALASMRNLRARRRSPRSSRLSGTRNRKRLQRRFALVRGVKVLGIGYAVYPVSAPAAKRQAQREEARAGRSGRGAKSKNAAANGIWSPSISSVARNRPRNGW